MEYVEENVMGECPYCGLFVYHRKSRTPTTDTRNLNIAKDERGVHIMVMRCCGARVT